MLHALRTLRQSHLARQKSLAIGVARIDELNRTYPDGSYCDLGDRSIRYAAAWEDLFSKPEWNKAKASHQGRCSCCGASVGSDEAICGGCGATWNEPADQDKFDYQAAFGVIAAAISAVIGYCSGELFVYFATGMGGLTRVVTEGRGGFIAFVESYLWISVSVLSLLASTYVYQRTGLAPKGRWTPVTHRDSGALRP